MFLQDELRRDTAKDGLGKRARLGKGPVKDRAPGASPCLAAGMVLTGALSPQELQPRGLWASLLGQLCAWCSWLLACGEGKCL